MQRLRLRTLPFFLGLAGLLQTEASSPVSIPFAEEWDPFPLRFPYAESESLYLKPSPATPRVKAVSPAPTLKTRFYALPASANRLIRVLLVEKSTGLAVEAGAGVKLKMKRSDGAVSEGPILAGPLKIELKAGEFRVVVPGRKPFSTGPARAIRLTPQNAAIRIGINGKSYRGDLELAVTPGSGFQILNVLGIEDYLRGVLPKEMGNRGDEALEALKAQAVVARTYGLKRMLVASPSGFDVYASVQDQVYGGADVEYGLSDRAVAETRGIVLRHADSLAFCYYHSTCGGMTASRHEVWGGPVIPYLLSRPDRDAQNRAWCQASTYMQWTQRWKISTLTEILQRNLEGYGGGFSTLKKFQILDRFSCGRIHVLQVETDRGIRELRGDKIRFALKPGSGDGRILESARFTISIVGDQIIAKGSGFGHGIGLCQMGALGRSAAGQGFAEILSAYYPGTEIGRTH